MAKLKNFFKNNYSVILPAFMVFLIVLICFMINQNWPFGHNSVAIYDLYYQGTTIPASIIDVFTGKASLFYTNKVGGGVDLVSLYIYMSMSPFFIIYLFTGKALTGYAVNIILMLNMICASLSVAYMLKRVFPYLNKVIAIFISVAYAMSSYVLQDYTILTWLNFMILCPLLVVAFKRLVEDKKYLLFSFLTFIYIASCVAMGSITQFVLLAIYYLYVLLCVEKSQRKEVLVRLTIAMLVAVLLSSIVLVPSLISMMRGVRQGELFEYIFKTNPDRYIEMKYLFLVCDFAFIFLEIVFICLARKKDKANIFLIILAVAVNLMLLCDVCIMLLSFGVNYSYPTRLCYLNEIVAVLCIAKLVQEQHLKNEYAEKGESSINIILIFIGFIFTCIIVYMLVSSTQLFLDKEIGGAIATIDFDVSELYNFYPFALITISFFAILMLVFKFLLKQQKLGVLAMCILLGGQICLCTTVFVNLSFKLVHPDDIEAVSNLTDEYDRVQSKAWNYSILMDCSTINIFSSFTTKKAIEAYSSLAYDSQANAYGSSCSTLLSSSFMGVGYYYGQGADDVPYYNEEYYNDYSNMGLYSYEYATTGAFLLDENFTYDDDKNIYENLNAMAINLGATSDIFKIYDGYDFINHNITEINEYGIVNYSDKYLSDGFIVTQENSKFYISSSNSDVIVYYSISEDIHNAMTEDAAAEYSYDGTFAYMVAPFLTAKNSIDFLKNMKIELEDITVAVLDLDVYETQFNKIKQNQTEIEYTSDGFKFSGDLTEDKILVVSNVNIDGLNCTVNGQEVEIMDYAGGFCAIQLHSGHNEVVVSYTPQYLWLAIGAIVACIGLAVFVIFLYNKHQKVKWLSCWINWLYAIYLVGFVGFIIVFPSVLTIIKLIKL